MLEIPAGALHVSALYPLTCNSIITSWSKLDKHQIICFCAILLSPIQAKVSALEWQEHDAPKGNKFYLSAPREETKKPSSVDLIH